MRFVPLVVLLVTPLVAAEGSERAATHAYALPSHNSVARFVTCASPIDAFVEGACFDVAPGESRVDVSIDDATMLPIVGRLFFLGAASPPDSPLFCGAIAHVAIPAGATRARIEFPPIDGTEGPIVCPPIHGEATVGSVTATFR